MKGFLEELAEKLYARYDIELSDRIVLFPSRRARLFFMDALANIADRPVWQPRWGMIDELMSEISGLRTGERVRLITELYKVYSEFHEEPFDKFYFWGDMLLNDFDTIDKYLIDADMLFANMADIKEIEADLSYLTPAQVQIIRTFWSSFGAEADLSEEQRRFLAIWKTLAPIYHRYRERLSQAGIAYNGMVQRAAAERLQAGDFEFPEKRRYIVAGFNALSECEKKLFRFLQTHAETEFYWDYDNYYVDHPEQEAGMFVRNNRMQFPAQEELSHDHLQQEKELTAVSTVSNAVQCKYAAKVIQELAGDRWDKRTAVVLTDENLLMPLLYALPADKEINVTMGYPLRSTLAYTFVERLIELQNHRRTTADGNTLFYHADVTGLLAHPYVDSESDVTAELQKRIVRERRMMIDAEWLGATEVLQTIFTPAESWRELSDYLLRVLNAIAQNMEADEENRRSSEYLSVSAEEIAKLRNSLEGCSIELTPAVYASLLRRHLQTMRIPFEGEPLRGVQVMGILETRNLDFDQVVILSMNDDNFPGNRLAQASFIPYNLRAAYELPTPEHHEGVYAYYFYRLIQRARKVQMIYCSRADEKSTGEPSRYIRQLDYESPIPVKRVEVGVDVHLANTEKIEVAKTEEIMRRLSRFTDPERKDMLSPTAFFRHIACPMKFYFASVARLKTDDEVSEEIDASMFGTILHAAVQKLYGEVRNELHPGESLRALIRSGAVGRAVEESINENYLHDPKASVAEYPGNLVLVKDIVARYLSRGVLPYDARNDHFTVTGLEEWISYDLPFRTESGEQRTIRLGGIADRIDRMDDGTLRVVDYKTGTPHLEFAGLEALFRGEGKQRLSNIVQTFLYSMMLYKTRNLDVVPVLYYVRAIHRPEFSPLLIDHERNAQVLSYRDYKDAFEELVTEELKKIYDPSIPFTQCEDTDTCAYCDFKTICRR